MPSKMPPKIDVHSHFLPPFYREALLSHGHGNPDGMPYVPEWSEDEHLALMDNLGISKSILSCSSPGCHLVPGDDQLGRSLARRCNRYAADVKQRRPDRFGYFASLPLPDVAGCLAEIPAAIEDGCDGFTLLTNVHGYYLGDERFDPIFDALNQRKAVIFIHPTTPQCACQGPGEEPMVLQATPFAGKYPNPMLEFLFDTARAITNLFLGGTIKRCPDVKIILPHLGGAFPPLLSRWTGFSSLVPGPWTGVSEAEVLEVFNKQIWFDMAGFAFPSQIKGLVQGVEVHHSRLLYGSDFPFTRANGVEMLLGQMDDGVKELFSSEDEIEDLYHRNAEKLLEDGG